MRLLTDQPAEVAPPLGQIPVLAPRGHGSSATQAPPEPEPTRGPPRPILSHHLVLDVTLAEGRPGVPSRALRHAPERARGPVAARPYDRVVRSATPPGRRRGAARRTPGTACATRCSISRGPRPHRPARPLATRHRRRRRGARQRRGARAALRAPAPARRAAAVHRPRRPDASPRARHAIATPTPPLPGPLKILAAVGAPEETRTGNGPVDVEAEMQALLDAVTATEQQRAGAGADPRGRVPAEIEQALRADQYHVLHLFGARLRRPGSSWRTKTATPSRPPPTSWSTRCARAGTCCRWWCCRAAPGAAGGTDGLAAALVAPRRGPGAGHAATGHRHLRHRARPRASTAPWPRRSRTAARRSRPRARRSTSNAPGAAAPAEHRSGRSTASPTLLAAGADLPLRRPARYCRAARPRATQRAGRGGAGAAARRADRPPRPAARRRSPRCAAAPATGERSGTWAGAVLTGVGGIGKTAVAGRIWPGCAATGWLIAEHVGAWNPPALIAAVADALDGDARHAAARRAALRGPAAWTTREARSSCCSCWARCGCWCCSTTSSKTSPADARQFSDPGFAEIFARRVDAARAGRMLVTCRYPVPDADALAARSSCPRADPGRAAPAVPAPARAARLPDEDRRLVARTIGGHPRLIEFVDVLLRDGRGNLRRSPANSAPSPARRASTSSGRARARQTVSDAVLLGSRDIVLDELLRHLDDEERELALQAAVSRVPTIDLTDLRPAHSGESRPPEHGGCSPPACESPDRLDAHVTRRRHDVVVHPWVVQALDQHQGDKAAANATARARDAPRAYQRPAEAASTT